MCGYKTFGLAGCFFLENRQNGGRIRIISNGVGENKVLSVTRSDSGQNGEGRLCLESGAGCYRMT